jgi:hypothetical protein
VGWVLVVPRVAGAQQGLKGSGLRGEGRVSWRAVGPAPGWGQEQTGGGDPGGCGSSGMAKGRVFWCGVAFVAEGQISPSLWVWKELWLGAAQGAERSSGSADLQAGCSFIRSWCGEAFPDLRVYRAVFLSVPGALPQAGVSPASPQGLWVSS